MDCPSGLIIKNQDKTNKIIINKNTKFIKSKIELVGSNNFIEIDEIHKIQMSHNTTD